MLRWMGHAVIAPKFHSERCKHTNGSLARIEATAIRKNDGRLEEACNELCFRDCLPVEGPQETTERGVVFGG